MPDNAERRKRVRPRRRAAAAVFLAAAALALAASALAAPPAGLSQVPGKAGCIAGGGWKGQCTKGRGLGDAFDLAVSPDGRNVYVASSDPGAVAVFDRLPGSGRLRQQPGAAGCVAKAGAQGCARGSAIADAEGVAVSPDGRNVYLATESQVAVFARDRRGGELRQQHGVPGAANAVAVSPDGRNVYATYFGRLTVFERDARTGALRQLAGAGGCVSGSGNHGCAKGHGISYPDALTVSPDGRNLYLADYEPGAVLVFRRNPATGAVTQAPGTAGCFTEEGSGGACGTALAVAGATAVTVSPDGRNVYVAGSEEGGLAIFKRDPGDGSLRQPAGKAGCVQERLNGNSCSGGVKTRTLQGVAVSPDGDAVYAVGDSALAIFRRNHASGALTQPRGKPGCIAEHGNEGRCQDGTGLADAFHLAVSPDGRNVYGVSVASSAVAIFDR